MFNYKIIRTKRRTISLQIITNKLIVRSPKFTPIHIIESFIYKKSSWINKHLTNTSIIKKYKNGEKFLYLGLEYPLTKTNDKLFFNGINFIGNGSFEDFLFLYKSHFMNLATSRINFFSKKYNLPYNKLSIRAQKTRWGSCSATNNISLNYLLMMAPVAVIDNVIVHELCHTVHKNHAKEFWQLVLKILPDYKIHHKWLKKNSTKLYCLFNY